MTNLWIICDLKINKKAEVRSSAERRTGSPYLERRNTSQRNELPGQANRSAAKLLAKAVSQLPLSARLLNLLLDIEHKKTTVARIILREQLRSVNPIPYLLARMLFL